jgi:hypothetical protein
MPLVALSFPAPVGDELVPPPPFGTELPPVCPKLGSCAQAETNRIAARTAHFFSMIFIIIFSP